jgi:predicted acyl esterase
MSNELTTEKNLLIPMPDGVELAADVIRPGGSHKGPAILTYIPYHKDGRGGRMDVECLNRHFANRGYAALTVDFRGLGNSGGCAPEPFAPGEAQDGHAVVEWIARQPWCDGNVGMWGVSYGGITSLSTAATRPPHLKAIVPVHATSDLYRGVIAPGGCGGGFWMRADWGPRMIAYNLLPPLLQDIDGRWARVWADHLAGNPPWLTAWVEHPRFDEYWHSRVALLDRIECPVFSICGWRDLYADCTPRDFSVISAPKKLLMGPWKHEFPDKGLEAPCAGLWEMERWFDRWLRDMRNGVDTEAPVSLYVQGAGVWRTEAEWPPRRLSPLDFFLTSSGGFSLMAPNAATTPCEYQYDATVGLQSLAWDPWTTSLDPALPRDQSGDDARSLCFTGEPLTEPLELLGVATALLEVTPSALPLNVVAKISEISPNGRSTLITTGWLDLAVQAKLGMAKPGQRMQVEIPLRATAYRLAPGNRLRLAISCADFPRLWPTPKPAALSLHFGASRVRLPVCPPPPGEPQRPDWGKLQKETLMSPNDLGGGQSWETQSDLMTDTVSMAATKTEHARLDPFTVLHTEHAYGAAVSSSRPDLARMSSTTTTRVERATSRVELTARTVTTAHQVAAEAEIFIDGQPFWKHAWRAG